jgi:hypothetical protein
MKFAYRTTTRTVEFKGNKYSIVTDEKGKPFLSVKLNGLDNLIPYIGDKAVTKTLHAGNGHVIGSGDLIAKDLQTAPETIAITAA